MRLFVLSEIHRLAAEGRSYKEISRIIGTGYTTLRRWKRYDSAIEIAYTEGVLRVPLGTVRLIDGLHPQTGKERDLVLGECGEPMARPVIDLKGIKQPFGKLTAREFLGIEPGRGAMWLCDCDCGGEIKVEGRRFNSSEKGVYACESCTNPAKRRRQEELTEYNKAKALELGPEWGIPDFEETWQSRLLQLSPEQELLFETICDGRYTIEDDLWGDEYDNPYQVQMEALDVVLHSDDIWGDLSKFGTDRVARARQRLNPERRSGLKWRNNGYEHNSES